MKDYYRKWTSGDVDGAMESVAEDVFCRAPGVDISDKGEYREFIAKFAPRLTGVSEIAEFTDGDRVVLFYYPQTAATSTAVCAECMTVRAGKIVENVMTFDRLSYSQPSGSES
ncbi:MAG: nuclear transport factor 2 family protein [Actinomycetaceae bacterium]|nr:nuclear transport factor 2 family protein [Actinomycetaceae bacterium]